MLVHKSNDLFLTLLFNHFRIYMQLLSNVISDFILFIYMYISLAVNNCIIAYTTNVTCM